MPLREEFERSGNLLFRWRSYLPLLLLPIILIALRNSEYMDGKVWNISASYFEFFAMLLSFLGLGIRCITIGFVPRGTSGNNVRGQLANTLNTSGMYSLTHHPLYLGNSLITFGVTVFVGTWWLPVLTALVFWLYYERIMFAEEEFLRKEFGDVYIEWASGIPAFIPRFRNWRRPELGFSFQTVLKREYSSFFGIVSAFTLLELFRDSLRYKKLHVDPLWLAFFCAGLAFYLFILILKKKTRSLYVEGR